MDMSGKAVLVTGTASGIGRETAYAFARAGAKQIACLDIHAEGNRQTVETLRGLGAEPIDVVVDLGRVDQIRAAFATAHAAFGRLDAAALIGGYSWRAETLDVTEAQWDAFVNSNLRGTFFCCQEALKIMYDQGDGSLVTTSADGAFFPVLGLAVQAAVKGGISLMSRTLAFEAAKRGVRVNCVSPGIVRVKKSGWVSEPGPAVRRPPGAEAPPPVDDMHKSTAAGRFMKEAEIAETMVFLCSDAARGISGQTISVNAGGYRTMEY